MEAETSNAQAIEIPDGVRLPPSARLPEGVSFFPEVEGDTYCRVVGADGTRCRARRMRSYSVCSGHGGRGLAADPAAAQQKSKEARARLVARRQLLGIGPSGRASPRALAKMRAFARAEELSQALVDGPLDDGNLSAMQRQLAAARVLDSCFPATEATVELSLAADPETMDWETMKRLASLLAIDADTAATEREIIESGGG